MRRILVVNDDGIGAEGIVRLAAAAKNLGEVWVVAPGQQCSAMSHCITVRGSLQIRQEDFRTGRHGLQRGGNARRLCESGNPPPYAGQA
ncbi:MAG: 5'/3'-nucleotidase SurE [Eisenbergiella massiliensis]